MSDLVGNPEDRFSRVAAQIMPYTYTLFKKRDPSDWGLSQPTRDLTPSDSNCYGLIFESPVHKARARNCLIGKGATESAPDTHRQSLTDKDSKSYWNR